MAENNNMPWQGFATQYGQQLAGTLSPRLDFVRGNLASLLQREQELPGQISALFDPARQAAANVGTDIATAGGVLTGALAGGLQGLPGLDQDLLINAARQTGRAGASGAMLGSSLLGQAEMGQALSLADARKGIAAERLALRGQEADILSEQKRMETDILPYAQQRQQMRTTALQNEQITQEIKSLKTMRPIEVKNALLSNKMLREQIAGQVLTNADARATLIKAGYKVSKDGTVTDPNGKVIFQPIRS